VQQRDRAIRESEVTLRRIRGLFAITAVLAVLAACLTGCSKNAPRTYLLHAPACAAPCAPRPLVLVLHGLGETAAQAQSLTNFNAYADADGFVVAYPQALATDVGNTTAWNAGTSTAPTQCCAAATADDTSWLAGLPKTISARVPIDLKRVYIAGFSNGGMMAWKAACQRPDVFAAAEVVSGSLLVPCTKTVVHILDAHDPTNDCIVPYHGGYTCGAKPTVMLPAKFPNSANEAAVVGKGSIIDFVPLTSSHTWPKLVLDVVTNPTTPTAYPEHAAEFGWTFLQQWSLR
jgi:poly(3-hydroxybutyrate) depolymerase